MASLHQIWDLCHYTTLEPQAASSVLGADAPRPLRGNGATTRDARRSVRLLLPGLRPTVRMDSMDFEWDAAKAETNLVKHGVSFKEAATVFGDPFAMTYGGPKSL